MPIEPIDPALPLLTAEIRQKVTDAIQKLNPNDYPDSASLAAKIKSIFQEFGINQEDVRIVPVEDVLSREEIVSMSDDEIRAKMGDHIDRLLEAEAAAEVGGGSKVAGPEDLALKEIFDDTVKAYIETAAATLCETLMERAKSMPGNSPVLSSDMAAMLIRTTLSIVVESFQRLLPPLEVAEEVASKFGADAVQVRNLFFSAALEIFARKLGQLTRF